MAGNYPDVPAPRLAYHLDGSIAFRTNFSFTTEPTQFTSQQIGQLNDESTNIVSGQTLSQTSAGFGLIFPELRDIAGIALSQRQTFGGGGATRGALQWSPDTTTGLDGTWHTIINPWPETPNSKAGYREGILAVDLNGVKGIRWPLGYATAREGGLVACHLYGTITAGQNPHRLALWHPTEDEPLDGPYFDWGDVPRGSSDTRTFRVKNLSPDYEAFGVVVGVSHPTDATPTLSNQVLLSTPSSPTPEAQKSVGDIEASGFSPVVTLHRDIASDAQLSLWWSLISAVATEWEDEQS